MKLGEYVRDNGFTTENGAVIWKPIEEFLKEEYLDLELMRKLLNNEEFEAWRKDTGNYRNVPIGTVNTPLGIIQAFLSSDEEYPGISLGLFPKEREPEAILEYDSHQKKISFCVYGKPVDIYKMA